MPAVKLHQQTADAEGLRHLAEPAQERLRDLEGAAQPAQSLRRTGMRPYAFNGTIVATVSGVTPALPFWYEINVYETVLNTYVSDIRLFNNDADLADLFRVAEHDGLEAAFDHLERYDASADLIPGGEIGEPTASNAELALRVARLQMRVNEITAHYRAVVADLLQALQPRLG